jgi:hypothetical protein
MEQTQQIAASRRKPFILPFSLFLHDFAVLCQQLYDTFMTLTAG